MLQSLLDINIDIDSHKSFFGISIVCCKILLLLKGSISLWRRCRGWMRYLLIWRKHEKPRK